MFLLRRQEEAYWKIYAEHFEMPISLISDLPTLDKIAKLSEHWLQNEPFPTWWKLREILFNCCGEDLDEIRLVIHDIQEQVISGEKHLLLPSLGRCYFYSSTINQQPHSQECEGENNCGMV